MPATGTLLHLRAPAEIPGQLRVETGVRQGDRITPHYDPMIAKLVVWGEDRAAAVRRLGTALAAYEVVGLRTNLGLLRAIAAHPAFAAAELDTGFIARHGEVLLAPPVADATALWAAAALAVLRDQQAAIAAAAQASGDPWSPWATADAWRMNGEGYQDLHFRQGKDGGEAEPVRLRSHPLAGGAYRLDLPGGAVTARLEGEVLQLDGVTRRLGIHRRGAEITIILGGANHVLVHEDPLAPPATEAAGSDRVTAPVPGRVARVLVQPGDQVSRNAPLLVIEAMKTEFTLRAPMDGVVAAVRARMDEMVEEGTELVSFAG